MATRQRILFTDLTSKFWWQILPQRAVVVESPNSLCARELTAWSLVAAEEPRPHCHGA
jgi:hypothetical protein